MTERERLIRCGWFACLAELEAIRRFVIFLRAVAGEGAARFYDWRSVAIGAHDAAHAWADDAVIWAQGIDPDSEIDSADEGIGP